MQEVHTMPRAAVPSRARAEIAELEIANARGDAAGCIAHLAALIELALNGTLSERHEAAAYLEKHYGCVVTAPPAETVSVH